MIAQTILFSETFKKDYITLVTSFIILPTGIVLTRKTWLIFVNMS